MKVHHKLIDNLIADERVKKIVVFDGYQWEEVFLPNSNGVWPNKRNLRKAIIEEVNSGDVCNIAAYRADDTHLGTFFVVTWGVAEDEHVADYSVGEFTEQHWKLLETQGVIS